MAMSQTLDAKETIIAILQDFGKQISCTQPVMSDLTQKICIIIDILKQEQTLEYYHKTLQEFASVYYDDHDVQNENTRL